jgi:hypothetical protein
VLREAWLTPAPRSLAIGQDLAKCDDARRTAPQAWEKARVAYMALDGEFWEPLDWAVNMHRVVDHVLYAAARRKNSRGSASSAQSDRRPQARVRANESVVEQQSHGQDRVQ